MIHTFYIIYFLGQLRDGKRKLSINTVFNNYNYLY